MFRVAELAEALDNVEDQLFRFGRILEREPQLWGVLADRGVAASRKVELLQALLASKVDAVTLRLVELVVTQPRGRAIDAAVEELARLAAERQRRLIAIVQAAVDLTARERTQLSARLKEIYGHDVRLQVEIVPDVLGGLTIRVGDELIDGSIASRLEAARRRLAR
jgi:F-type H+-transporting ATPase subunit delta